MSKSNTNNLSWDSPLVELSSNPKKPSKTILKLIDNNILSIQDLLWILPLRLIQLPQIQPFHNIAPNKYFKGSAEVISINLTPAFGKKGKHKIQLFNATVVIKDQLSDQFLNLKWFNAYPNIKNQIENLGKFIFLGVAQDYKGIFQFVNPSLDPSDETGNLLIEYPTYSTISGNLIKKLIQKIPLHLWEVPIQYLPPKLSAKLQTSPLNKTFRSLHGLDVNYCTERVKSAKEELIYFEFLKDHLKVIARKMAFKQIKIPFVRINQELINILIKSFPYKLTSDQNKVITELIDDFKSGTPMMRIVQGDVGCGKTTVALIAALIIIEDCGQVALMCPTEALARQHLKTFKETLPEKNIKLLTGSSKSKEKQQIGKDLKDGKIDIVIGTHSLFQDSIEFQNLRFAIIDEQHKFGVEQRLKLISKGSGTHCLLMSATPIPRTLQLAQYGDLDISTIKSIPAGRKGTQTRIVRENTYEKYLSFIKTRIEMKEQVYIVVPAITDSEKLDLKNVESVVKLYSKYFPNYSIGCLHGQLKPEEKNFIMSEFEAHKIDILISTSVIEVGINVLNSTVMTIYNPDRFGLSSLHQLRGRVGRGKKPGFCFLIPDNKASQVALKRLQIVEKSHDGFEIADADLKNRGEGDLFGTFQSGNVSSNKVASIFEHFDIFEKVQKDVQMIKSKAPELFTPLIEELLKDKKISTTV